MPVSDPHPDRIAIGILGPLVLTGNDGRRLGGLSPKGAALIAYLALADGHRARRSRLATLLWSLGDAEHAHGSLRQLLRRLREIDAADPPWLIADREEVRLDWSRVDLDFMMLEAAATTGDAAAIDAAADMWRGPVLDGLEAASEPFDDWLRAARVQLTDRLGQCLHRRLVAAAPDDGVVDRLARLLLRIDPCDEAAAAALMRRDLAHGRTVRALRVYADAEAAMARDLGVKPNAALRELVAQARRATPVPPPSGADGFQLVLHPGAGSPPDPAELPTGSHWRQIDTDTFAASFATPRAALEAALVALSECADGSKPGLAIQHPETPAAWADAVEASAAIDQNGTSRIILDRRSYAELSAVIPALFVDQLEYVPGDPATRHYAIDLGDPALGVIASQLGRGTVRTAPALRQRRPVIAIAGLVWHGDPGDAAWLAQGLADLVAMTLAQGRWFDVVAAGIDGAAADYAVSGELVRSGDNVRIVLRIVRSADRRILSAWQHRSTVKELLTLDGDVVRQIVAVLEPNLIEAVWRSLEPAAVQATDAFHCVMRALQLGFRFTAADLEESSRLCDRAIAEAPGFAKAWACRALAAVLAIYMGWEPDAVRRAEEGLADAYRALALDACDPWSRFALGMVYLTAGATGPAHDELARAIELNPGFAWAHGALGQSLVFLNRLDEGVGALRLALRLSPRDPLKVYWLVALALSEFLAGHREFALEWARLAAAERPDYPGAQRLLAITAKAMGHDAEAEAAFAAMQTLQPGFDMTKLTQVSPFSNPRHLPAYAAALHGLGWGFGPVRSVAAA